MIKERRRIERSDTYIITELKPFLGSNTYTEGITSNLTLDGFNFESQDFHPPFQELLEFNLKHPHNQLSFSASGTVVWKKDGWYKCTRGIKFNNLDLKAKNTINEIMSGRVVTCDKSNNAETDRSKPLDAVYDRISDLILEEDKLTEELNETSRKLQNEINERHNLEESLSSCDKRSQDPLDSLQNGTPVLDSKDDEQNSIEKDIKHSRAAVKEEETRHISLAVNIHAGEKKDFPIIGAVLTVAVLAAVFLIYDNNIKRLSPPTSVIASVDQFIPSINDEHINNMPLDMLFKPLQNYAAFDINRIKPPKPDQFIIPKKDKVFRKKPFKTPVSEPIIKIKHPLEVIANRHKEDFMFYEENFDDNKNNWFLFNTDEASASIDKGAYQIHNKRDSNPLFVLHHYDFPHEADFIIEAFIMPVKRSRKYSYGFLLGAKDVLNNYAFQIGSNNSYSIKLFIDGIEFVVADGKVRTGVIKRNSVNTIKIIKQGSEASFYINDVFLDIIANVDFYGNKVGFIVEGATKIAIEKEQSRIKQKTSLAGK